jgi:hypothetical protein
MSIRDLARYAHRAMHFGALPSHHGAWFVDAGRLYVSDEENRGRQLRRHVGVLQPLVSHTWRRIVRHLQPTVVLDIGANSARSRSALAIPPIAACSRLKPTQRCCPSSSDRWPGILTDRKSG